MNKSTPSVETILAQAVEIAAPAERQAFVEEACGGDLALQRRVEQLIACGRANRPFLRTDRPTRESPRMAAATWGRQEQEAGCRNGSVGHCKERDRRVSPQNE